jgi:hypothetical protein
MTAQVTTEPAGMERRLDQGLEKQKPCDDATATMSDTSGGSGAGEGASPSPSPSPASSASEIFDLASNIMECSQRLKLTKRHMVDSKRVITNFFGSPDEHDKNNTTASVLLEGAEEEQLDSNSIATMSAGFDLQPAPEFMEHFWRSCITGLCGGDLNEDETMEDEDEETLVEENDRSNKKRVIAANLLDLVEQLTPSASTDRNNSIPNTVFISSEQWADDISISTAMRVREEEGFEVNKDSSSNVKEIPWRS